MKTPFVYIFIGFATLLVSFFFSQKLFVLFFCLFLFISSAVYLKCEHSSIRTFSLFFGLSMLCFSFLLLSRMEQRGPRDDQWIGQKSIIATVKSLPQVYSPKQNKNIFFLAKANQIIDFEGEVKKNIPFDEMIYVTLFQADQVPVLGDSILLYGDINFLPERLNRFEKDYWKRWRNKNVQYFFTGYGRNAFEVLQKKNKFMHLLLELQGNIEVRISKLWKNPIQRSYFKALLLGQKQSIPKEDREAFAKTGVAHILVVSGLHVTLVASFTVLFLFLIGYKAAMVSLLTSFFIVFYAMLANLGLPVVRASIMSVLFLISFLLRRRTCSFNLLFFVASGMMIFDPSVLFDLSFQLSFLSVLAMMMSNILSFRSFMDPRYLSYFSLAAMMKKTVVIMLFTTPVFAMFFHEISWVGILTNIWVIPCFSLTIFFAFFAFYIDGVSFLSLLSADIAGSILLWTRASILYLSKLPLLTIHLHEVTRVQIVLYYLALGLLFYSYRNVQKPGFSKIFQAASCSLVYMTIFFIIPPISSGMYFNFFHHEKNFNCVFDFGGSQKWMFRYQRGTSRKDEKNILDNYFEKRGLKEMTGLITTGSPSAAGKQIQKSKVFKYILSTNQKFDDRGRSEFERKMKEQDKVVLTSQKINIEILAIKNNEAIWHIFGDGFSILLMPFWDQEITHKLRLDFELSPDLIVFIPNAGANASQIEFLESEFEVDNFIVNKMSASKGETALDTKNLFILERDGQVDVQFHQGLLSYRSFKSV